MPGKPGPSPAQRARRRRIAAALGAAVAVPVLATLLSLHAPPSRFPDGDAGAGIRRVQYLDRHGSTLNETRINDWNFHHRLPLHDVPALLQQAVVLAEDQRFYRHHGIDWPARLHALWQNIEAGRVVRGASTISEQTVRLLQPRPRTLWSRWLEGWEALWLEQRHSKPAILEFYLNQVPYAANRRGIVPAARYYFGRDPDTLNERELLMLAVLIRSPSGMAGDPARLDRAVTQLAGRLRAAGVPGQTVLPDDAALLAQVISRPLQDADTQADPAAFLSALRDWPQPPQADNAGNIATTLDLALQRQVQQLLAAQLRLDADLDVRHAAALVVDHRRNEVLAWVVASRPGEAPTAIDAVRVRRQPGSTLKPLVYAAAFEKGWTPSTMILDAPLEQLVGAGMHEYNNYSRLHYGWISAREALGNSLNVPAVKAVQFTGTAPFLQTLRTAGIASLSGHPNVYGDGLALGNGEVTLYELVSAYAVLARGGVYRPFTPFAGEQGPRVPPRNVFRPETASLIADILSDDNARAREFGAHGVLDFPVQTAVKTGTSSDYRDAWTLAFNDCCVIGVWFGNLDYRPMHEITGARGPAPVVRGIVAGLNRERDTRALVRHAGLRRARVCIDTGLPADAGCEARDEWFAPWMTPGAFPDGDSRVRIRKPGPGLRLAMDPRIPDDNEAFEFLVQAPVTVTRVQWQVNGRPAGESAGSRFVWPLQRGEHRLRARVWQAGSDRPVETEEVPFTVR